MSRPTVLQPDLIPMSAGERLLQARLEQRLKPVEVAARLKISVARVADLESDEPGELAPVYYRGLLKSYAELLGLEPQTVLGAVRAAPADDIELRPVTMSGPSLGHSERLLKASSYLLATLLVGTLAWQITHEAVRLAEREVEQAGERTGQNVGEGRGGRPGNETGGSSDGPMGEVGATSEPPWNPVERAPVSASIAGFESVLGDDDTDDPRQQRGSAGAAAWDALSATSREPRAPQHEGLHRLEVRASADSWVEIIGGDDELLEQDLLRGGDHRRYRGSPPFRISIGRSSAVQLFLDGEAVALAPHTQEDVARLVLAPQRIAQRPPSDRDEP